MSTLTQNLSAKQYMLVKTVFLYKQILHLPYIPVHTEHILENEDKKLLFRVCCMRYWMASGHSLLQKMTKEWVRTRSYFDFEEYYFWKSSPHTERYINHIFSSLMFSVRRYLLSLIQCLAQHRITSLELQKILQLFQYSHISRVRKLERRSNICSTSYRNTCTILIEIGE